MSWQTITTINNENRLYWGWVNHQEGECLQREPRGTSLMQPQSAFSSPQEEAVGWGRWPLKTFILYCSIFSCVWRFWQDCGYLGRRRRLPEALLEGTSVSIRSSELHSIVIPCWVLGAGETADLEVTHGADTSVGKDKQVTNSDEWNGETTIGTAETNPQSVGREGLMEKVASELRNGWQGRTGWVSISGEGFQADGTENAKTQRWESV